MDFTLLGLVEPRLAELMNLPIFPEYADRSDSDRGRSSLANISQIASYETSPGWPCGLVNSAEDHRPSSPALTIADNVGTHSEFTSFGLLANNCLKELDLRGSRFGSLLVPSSVYTSCLLLILECRCTNSRKTRAMVTISIGTRIPQHSAISFPVCIITRADRAPYMRSCGLFVGPGLGYEKVKHQPIGKQRRPCLSPALAPPDNLVYRFSRKSHASAGKTHRSARIMFALTDGSLEALALSDMETPCDSGPTVRQTALQFISMFAFLILIHNIWSKTSWQPSTCKDRPRVEPPAWLFDVLTF
jgi:hypothetical protein